MQITVFGASGKVGRMVVMQALKRGYTVVAFVHGHDPFVPTDALIVRKGDIGDAQAVRAALQGSEAVVSTLGSWGTKTRDIVSRGMQAIIPAMEQQGIRRIVTLTGSGAADPTAKAGTLHKLFMKLMAPVPAGKVFNDGEEHMRLLAASGLDWTTIRSPVMTTAGSAKYHLTTKPAPLYASASRSSVATCLLDQLETNKYYRQAPILRRR